MDVSKAIEKRRAYRSLEKVPMGRQLILDLAASASLAPSCNNRQPWRFVFVHSAEKLAELHGALSPGNEWARAASMIVAVCGKREDDCISKDGREYYLFDIGMGTAFLILRATELGLVAHPISGFDPETVSKALAVPTDYKVIALINVGKKSPGISSALSEKQAEIEKKRPERFPLEKFVFENKWGG